MSDPAVWGPSMWRILHTLAERLGKQTTAIQIQDEQRAWINFLRCVENVIPCKRCKAHYRDWSLKNRIDAAVHRISARNWLWKLHTEVNKDRQVEGVPVDEMEGLYGNRSQADLSKDVEECLQHLLNAVQRAHIVSESLRTFRHRLSLLRRFTG